MAGSEDAGMNPDQCSVADETRELVTRNAGVAGLDSGDDAVLTTRDLSDSPLDRIDAQGCPTFCFHMKQEAGRPRISPPSVPPPVERFRLLGLRVGLLPELDQPAAEDVVDLLGADDRLFRHLQSCGVAEERVALGAADASVGADQLLERGDLAGLGPVGCLLYTSPSPRDS